MTHPSELPETGCFSSHARLVRSLLREATDATLATLDLNTGHPFASLIQIATLPSAAPCFLISGLAQHTKNLAADPRSSILIDCRRQAKDDAATARVTLVGSAQRLTGPDDVTARERFLSRHPAAEPYAGFGDFSVWSLLLARAHLVAGFGRIRSIAGDDVELGALCECVAEKEAESISQLRNETQTSLDRLATRIIGWDIEGIDMAARNGPIRLAFGEPRLTPEAALAEARSAVQQFIARA